MELRDGRVTGSHFAHEFGNLGPLIPLTYSKMHAEKFFRECELSPSRWAVRGLPRHAYRAFLGFLELYEARGAGAAICLLPPGAREDAGFACVRAWRADLIQEYYDGEIPRSPAALRSLPRTFGRVSSSSNE